MTINRFRTLVWEHAKRHGRHGLPWRRRTTTPYQILVSEIMLQQTQVDRVIPYYRSFLKQFPTTRALANAPLSAVLRAWQGLGYNRRGRMLQEAARKIMVEHAGKIPERAEALEKLPGVGPYTARAILAFVYNQDVVFIETNLRTAIMHHFFPGKSGVTDAELLTILANALPKGKARDWYAALMDYGAHLKRSGVRINTQSATYTKQKAFKGSVREVRGAILKALLQGPQTEAQLRTLLGSDRKDQVTFALTTLVRDGMLQKVGRAYQVPTSDHQSSVRSKDQGARSRRP